MAFEITMEEKLSSFPDIIRNFHHIIEKNINVGMYVITSVQLIIRLV